MDDVVQDVVDDVVLQRPGAAPGTLGARVRELRAARGWSLSHLARRAHVGKATLSGLEAGTRTPTIETVRALASELEVGTAELIEGPAPDPLSLLPGQRRRTVSGGVAVTAELLDVLAGPGTATELYQLLIRPGRVQVTPAHPRGSSAHLTVFSGTARVGPAHEPRTVAPGAYAAWAADAPHTWEALGAELVVASLVLRRPAGASAAGNLRW